MFRLRAELWGRLGPRSQVLALQCGEISLSTLKEASGILQGSVGKAQVQGSMDVTP